MRDNIANTKNRLKLSFGYLSLKGLKRKNSTLKTEFPLEYSDAIDNTRFAKIKLF